VSQLKGQRNEKPRSHLSQRPRQHRAHILRGRSGGGAMIPRKFEPVLFGLVLSGLMSLIVSAISTAVARGFGSGFFGLWISSWLTAWVLAFPIVLLVGPMARRMVQRVLKPE
ncbi:MAG: DUF2798 domain-containing protein, partial [Burkholderiaceae bacterium]|nr:DUF2798 domain-containing protein [Burkholderiaceae bacterium]